MVTATGYFSPENSGLTPLQPQQWEAFRRISSEMVTAQGLATNVYWVKKGRVANPGRMAGLGRCDGRHGRLKWGNGRSSSVSRVTRQQPTPGRRLVGAAFLAGMPAVSVSSTSSWAQSSPEQEGVNKPIEKKPSRKTAASPAATTESAKGERAALSRTNCHLELNTSKSRPFCRHIAYLFARRSNGAPE
jgi:hypothetical protein